MASADGYAVTAEDVARDEPGKFPESRGFLGHPAGLAYIVFTEAWERFSFYGMQALLVLYMATYLLHPGTVEGVTGFTAFQGWIESVFGDLSIQALASQIFGIYIGLIYFMPVIGGYLGDRILGRTRAVLLGAVFMALGHFLMAFEASFLFALALLVLGSGLLKGNLAAQVGGLYAKSDLRRDSAFTIYNVAINIGATVAPLVCGTLGELYGWHYGFAAAGIGMLVGIVIYVSGRGQLPPDAATTKDAQPPRLQPGDGRIVAAILVMFFIATLFWATQTQVWNTYPLWIKAHVNREILTFTMPVTWFQSIDAGAVLVFAPLVLWYWQHQSKRGVEPGDFTKILIGYALYTCAFVWLAAGELTKGTGNVALFWPVTFHFILAAGFLYVGPIMMSLVSRAAPAAINATMVSSYYLSIFAGGFLSGWLGRFYETMTAAGFWLMHAAIVGGGFVCILLLRNSLARAMKLEGE